MPVRHALIEHGNFTQVLVCNAGHVKNVPGRKTGLRAIYTACEADAAYAALADFSGPPLGKKYPAAVAVRERAWTGSSHSWSSARRCGKCCIRQMPSRASTGRCARC